MFKLNKNKDGFQLECESINDSITNYVVRMLSVNGDGEYTEKEVKQVLTPIEPQAPKDTFKNGQRLPNENSVGPTGPNVVDLGDVKNGKPTYYKYFRCPDCGQSILTVIDGVTIVRDITGEKSMLYSTEIKCPEEIHVFTKEEYLELLANIERTEKNEVMVSKVEGKCTHCPVCGKDGLLNDWVNAFENPLSYFENEKPCPICGSEMCINLSEEGKQVIKCENKDCLFISQEEVKV